MNRLREMATWNIRPAIEYHRLRHYGWEILGFAVLVVAFIAIVVGGFLL